jgi:hypothetical protein
LSRLLVLPCLDSPEMAATRRAELAMPRDVPAPLAIPQWPLLANDTLVLGAWGCGALGQDPSQTVNEFS